MSRSLRIQCQGAWYHVMNRGAAKRTIFHSPKHFEIFLYLLQQATEQFKIEIHAYCLMNNHYHLLVCTPHGNLSNAMRYINGLYAQKYNSLHKIDGPLFRGRFKAILVDEDSYLLQLSCYIHLNPVAAGISKLPEHYQWSSYKFYVKLAKKPMWLFCEKTLNFFKNSNQFKLYRNFVLQGMEDFSNDSLEQNNSFNFPILGKKEFIDKIINEHDLILFHEEVPDYYKIHKKTAVTTDSIINAVAKYYDICPNDITASPNNKKRGNLTRKIAIFLAVKKTMRTHKDIANLFGGISCAAISKSYRLVEQYLQKDKIFSKEIHEILESLNVDWDC